MRQLFPAILAITFLVAETLRGDDQVTRSGEAFLLLNQEPFFDLPGDAGAGSWIPAQHRFGSDFIDILPAGASGANERPLQFPIRDVNILSNVKHG